MACVSARMSDHESDRLFQSGRYEDAIARLSLGLKKQGESGRDSLLYLLDLGLVLHTAGQYAESNQAFLRADQMAEIKDYTSLATEAATLLTTENLKDYTGEDFEKVLINTYLAMNYAALGDLENARVEARRVNQKLYRMMTEGKRKYQLNAFARYFSAILYESEKNPNDAYVDYKNTWQLLPTFPGLGRDLWRCAWQLRMPDEMERWDREFGLTPQDHAQAQQLSSHLSEIIVVYENGISPIKQPHPSFESIPQFVPRNNPVQYAMIEIDGKDQGMTHVLENIEATAIHHLNENYAGILAKKLAGVLAKEGVAYGIEKATHNKDLGLFAKLFMFVTDEADLRSWNLLPKDLQLFRVAMRPGTYSVRAYPVGGAPLSEKKVTVSAGKKSFVYFRSIPAF